MTAATEARTRPRLASDSFRVERINPDLDPYIVRMVLAVVNNYQTGIRRDQLHVSGYTNEEVQTVVDGLLETYREFGPALTTAFGTLLVIPYEFEANNGLLDVRSQTFEYPLGW